MAEVTRRHSQLYAQVAIMVAALGAAQESTEAMGSQVTDMQDSLGVMESRLRDWDEREQQ